MNGIRLQWRLVLSLAVLGCTAGTLLAQAPRCKHCGSGAGLRRVCRPISTTRPVEFDYWDAAEDEIAVPLASPLFRCDCGGWAGSCCSSGQCQLCLTGGCRACCKVRPRNRLVRKTALQEVPVVVWIVEYVCGDCAAHRTSVHPVSPTGDPHFVGSEPPPWPAEQQLSTAHVSDLTGEERPIPAPAERRSMLDELFQTLQGSMLPQRTAAP